MPSPSECFRNLIERLIAESGNNQTAAGKRCGLQPGQMSYYLSGGHYPNLQQLERIGAKLGMSVSQMLEGETLPPPPKPDVETALQIIQETLERQEKRIQELEKRVPPDSLRDAIALLSDMDEIQLGTALKALGAIAGKKIGDLAGDLNKKQG